MDASRAMPSKSARPGVCTQLHQHDLNITPYPVPPHVADHVVAVSVLHFIEDLGAVFAEAARIIKDGGTVYFDVVRILHPQATEIRPGWDFSGLRIFIHSDTEVERLLAIHGFELVLKFPCYFFEDIFRADSGVDLTRFHCQAFLCCRRMPPPSISAQRNPR